MEKRLLLFGLAVMAVLLLWSQLFPVVPPPAKQGKEKKTAAAGSEGSTKGAPTKSTSGTGNEEHPKPAKPSPAKGETPAPVDVAPKAARPSEGRETVVATKRARWTLTTFGGGVAEVALKGYTTEPGQSLADSKDWYRVLSPLESDGKTPRKRASLGVELVGPDHAVVDLGDVIWSRVKRTEDEVVYRLALPKVGLALEKKLRFPKSVKGLEGSPFHVSVELDVEVTDEALAKRWSAHGLRIRLTGPYGIHAEPVSYGSAAPTGAVLTQDVVSPHEVKTPEKVSSSPKIWPAEGQEGPGKRVVWSGLESRFFTAILKAPDPKKVGAERAIFSPLPDKFAESKKTFVNMAAAIEFVVPLPKQGGTVERSFLFYVGPKDPHVLSQGPYSDFESIIDYGWFSFIASFLVLVLGALHAVVLNWGIAIILLTLLIRACLFPLSRKQQIGMQRYSKKMQRLKPKLDALKTKYANNKKKLQEEQMKLYREEGIRLPLGCLVMFLQFPIFIGLYQALRYAIGLRHSAFLWASDLTAPDRLLRIPATGLPLVPEYLNLLPILMAFSWFLASSVNTPMSVDPQQAQTMKIMKYTPVIFAIFLYNYPAGLALYMIVSSTWSVFETRLVRKHLAREEGIDATTVPAFRKGR